MQPSNPEPYRHKNLEQYMLRFSDYTAATIIGPRAAATFAHGAHSDLHVGDEVSLFQVPSDKELRFRVIAVCKEEDFVILDGISDFTLPLVHIQLPRIGETYEHVGFSNRSISNPFSKGIGIISTDMVDTNGMIRGTSGACEGDSGGPCITPVSRLIGMIVGAEAISVSPETSLQQLATQYAAKALIIPSITLISFYSRHKRQQHNQYITH